MQALPSEMIFRVASQDRWGERHCWESPGSTRAPVSRNEPLVFADASGDFKPLALPSAPARERAGEAMFPRENP
jgi:hypothetical protein